jgi:N utilization substance protein B
MTAPRGGRRGAPATGRAADGRSAARLAAVQALYQVELTGGSPTEVVEQFLRHHLRERREDDGGVAGIDAGLFAEIVRGVARRGEDIDRMLALALTESWTLERLEVVLRCILRAGAYELLARPGMPARAAINEYVELAHAFYAGAEPGMVNGLLDRLARRLRPDEFTAPDAHG